MIPTWPVSLPQEPLIAGFTEEKKSLITSVTTGNRSMIVRKVASRTQNKITVSFNFSDEEMDTFENFFNNVLDGGANVFTFEHPRTHVVYNMSFDPSQSVAYKVEPNGSMRFFKVSTSFIVWG